MLEPSLRSLLAVPFVSISAGCTRSAARGPKGGGKSRRHLGAESRLIGKVHSGKRIPTGIGNRSQIDEICLLVNPNSHIRAHLIIHMPIKCAREPRASRPLKKKFEEGGQKEEPNGPFIIFELSKGSHGMQNELARSYKYG